MTGRKDQMRRPAQEPAPAAEPADRRVMIAAAAARALLGLVFLYSAWHKVSAPAEEFAVVIESYRLPGLGAGLVLPLARLIPLVELFLGLALVAGYGVRTFAAAGGGLLLLFIAAIGSTVARGIPLDNCGCFGGGVHLTPGQAMGLDTMLAGLSYFAYRFGGACAPLDAWIEKGTEA